MSDDVQVPARPAFGEAPAVVEPLQPGLHENGAPPTPAPAALDITATLAELTGMDWVSKAAEHILRESKATKEAHQTGAEIFQRVTKLGVPIPVSENTFGSYLSYLV